MTKTPEYRSEPNPVLGLVPSTPDMLKLAEQSLLLLKQDDETNSTVEQRLNTAIRMKNPPKVDNNTSSTLSRATMLKEKVCKGGRTEWSTRE